MLASAPPQLSVGERYNAAMDTPLTPPAAEDDSTRALRRTLEEAERRELASQVTALTKKLHGAVALLGEAVATDLSASYLLEETHRRLQDDFLPCPHDDALEAAESKLAAIRSYLDEDRGAWAPDIYELLGPVLQEDPDGPVTPRASRGPLDHRLRRDFAKSLVEGISHAGLPKRDEPYDITPVLEKLITDFQRDYIIVPKPR